jgi:hypothetical protein
MVKRVEAHMMPHKHRVWTGNDSSNRTHNGKVPRNDTPLYMRLCWKANSDATERLIGHYELDMIGLLATGHIRADGLDHVRLRFVHADDGGIYIQTREMGPRLRVDTVEEWKEWV